MKNIAVIGAGVCGLTTAYTLVEAGYTVTLYAKALPPDTTSNRAAAFWFPYHIENDNRCIRWSQASYDKYVSLLHEPASGISLHQLIKVSRDSDPPATNWQDFIPANTLHALPPTEVPAGFQDGYSMQVPLVETQLFLPWLLDTLKSKGVELRAQEIKDLNDLSAAHDWVINCTGLGSRELCLDEAVYPIRGQVALLAPQENLPIFLYEAQPFYVVPRKDATLIGGTFEEHVWDLTPEPETVERLYQQALSLFPQLKQAPVVQSWSGLRPFRKEIRVEKEAGKQLIHNYGHGGSGFTLAWGCAADVLYLLQN